MSSTDHSPRLLTASACILLCLVAAMLSSCASRAEAHRPKNEQESEQQAIEHRVFYSGWSWSGN